MYYFMHISLSFSKFLGYASESKGRINPKLVTFSLELERTVFSTVFFIYFISRLFLSTFCTYFYVIFCLSRHINQMEYRLFHSDTVSRADWSVLKHSILFKFNHQSTVFNAIILLHSVFNISPKCDRKSVASRAEFRLEANL